MTLLTRIADKAGTAGSLLSVLGCGACFPAIASIGAAIGLGFLQEYEGLFVTRLMPLFAALALGANALGWLSHRQWQRSVLGVVGPTLVLGALGWLGGDGWSGSLLYVGLGLMLAVSVWDLLWPANRRCGPDGCELPTAST
jgi:mercuric ion transport protein